MHEHIRTFVVILKSGARPRATHHWQSVLAGEALPRPLAPSDGEGACFVVHLPLARAASQPADSVDKAGVPHTLIPPARTALIIDHEPEVGEMLAEVSGEAAQAAPMQCDYDVVRRRHVAT